MRRQFNRLTVTAVKAALRRAPAGKRVLLNDGNGLNLQIQNRVPSWLLRYQLNGQKHSMGLGPLGHVPLAAARVKAEDLQRLIRSGVDPLAHKRSERQTLLINTAKVIPTFAECAQRYIAAHRAEWSSAQHAAHWSGSLEAHVFPTLGKLPVNVIDTGLVQRVLAPIWLSKQVTASRVRSRIENVLDWAKTAGYRDETVANPARWKGHLENLLAKPGKVHTKQHHAALPHDEIGAFMARLRQTEGVAARALEFTILTASRTDEVLGAPWSEFNLDERLWTIPAPRTKSKTREHRVPLSDAALAILEQMAAIRQGDLVFPGNKDGRPLGHHALRRQLEALGRSDLTVHGFRGSFKTWAMETNRPRDATEFALSHTFGGQTEMSYWHGAMFTPRRLLMDDWANYCARTEPEEDDRVVELATARA